MKQFIYKMIVLIITVIIIYEFTIGKQISQLYIKKEFLGGCDIVKEMYENGELKKVLEEKNIPSKK